MISHFSKCVLIAAARKSLHQVVENRKVIFSDDLSAFPEEVQGKKAVYVSLWRWPQLDPRGSNGAPWPEKPLLDAVCQSARGCAIHETIFPRLTPRELNQVAVRIHLLGEHRQIDDLANASLDGCALYLRYQNHSGIFLPDVIRLAGWDPLEAASQLCLKSGLPGDMWMASGTELRKIAVLTFGEEEPGKMDAVDFDR